MRAATSTLASTRPLQRWLRDDPAWAAQPPGWRLRQGWLSLLGSTNWRLSSALARSSGPMRLQDPVLIVGPWRSGTTVMHELLAAATGCATPRTWQCMDPCAYRIRAAHRGKTVVARPMDGLEIDADSPQEDEFALLALGVESTYRAFWMPHRLRELDATLDPAHWTAPSQWLDVWERFLEGVVETSPGDRQPLILKSPNHTFRLAAIARRFPSARLVWMVRDPRDVYFSNRKMWSAMFDLHGLTPVSPVELDAFLVRALDASARVLRDLLDGHPTLRWTAVAHEALLDRPRSVVDQLRERLDLPRADDESKLIRALERTRRGRIEHYDTAVPDAARAACDELGRLHAQALGRPDAIR